MPETTCPAGHLEHGSCSCSPADLPVATGDAGTEDDLPCGCTRRLGSHGGHDFVSHAGCSLVEGVATICSRCKAWAGKAAAVCPGTSAAGSSPETCVCGHRRFMHGDLTGDTGCRKCGCVSWRPVGPGSALDDEDRAAISSVVHQNYYMPDVFAAVENILRKHATAQPSSPEDAGETPFVSGYCERGECDRCVQGPEFNLDGNMLAEECTHACHGTEKRGGASCGARVCSVDYTHGSHQHRDGVVVLGAQEDAGARVGLSEQVATLIMQAMRDAGRLGGISVWTDWQAAADAVIAWHRGRLAAVEQEAAALREQVERGKRHGVYLYGVVQQERRRVASLIKEARRQHDRADAAEQRRHEDAGRTRRARRNLLNQIAEVGAKALEDFAGTRGVNVGDEDGEWWSGYRQAQRECIQDAVERARGLRQGGGA